MGMIREPWIVQGNPTVDFDSIKAGSDLIANMSMYHFASLVMHGFTRDEAMQLTRDLINHTLQNSQTANRGEN